MEKTMEKIVALAKNRGFVYPGSEIYGGLANTWDYGNLGVELKNNVKKAWWQKFIQESPYNVGVDCAILMNSQTWVASGHLGGFSDPLMDCKQCKERFRADKLIEDYNDEHGIEMEGSVDGWSQEQMKQYIEDKHICCPSCGAHDFTDIRQFNLMFKTFQGVTEDAKNTVYLRPETAQGIFVNFKNVQRTSRKKVPFGIGQIGKSFRNEITPGNFTFRTREFEQMELEFFCKPGTDLEWFAYWKQYCIDWLQKLGIKPDEMRARDHSPEELCFYSKATTDLEFQFPFGWGELWGIADRTDYDLTQHQTVSGQDMTYFDDESKEKYIPYVIEPSLGADRVTLAFLCANAGKYSEGQLVGETLKFPTTAQEVEALLKRIGVDGVRYQEIFITSFDGDVLGLYDHLSEYENLDELNHLACLLSELTSSELETLEAVLDSGDHCSSVRDIINLTQNLDCYGFYPGVSDEETLGRIYVDDLEMLDVPDQVKPYFDYEAYGRDACIHENGRFAPGGYVVKESDHFVEVYHGLQDIPKEHKVFSFPKLSIREQMAAYQEIIDGSSLEGYRQMQKKDRGDR